MATPLHNDIYKLIREPIDLAALARHVRAPEDGAVVTFDGFVRNQSHNRPTLYLDYEAYESMALAKMREIGAQLHEKYRIHRVAMVHRLRRIAPPPSTPAASPLTPSSAPFQSGRRSTSKTAPSGPTANSLRPPRRHPAPNLHPNIQCK
jgi:hypothetical protein